MSALEGACTVKSSSEQIWTGLQSRPPDVTSRWLGPRTVRSSVSWVMITWDALMDRQTNRYDGKQFLPATSLAGGTNDRNNSYCIQYCFRLILSFHTAISHFNVCRFIIISVVTLSEITNIKELKNPHAGLFILLLWNDDPQSSTSETSDDTLGDVPSDTISDAKYLIGCGSPPKCLM